MADPAIVEYYDRLAPGYEAARFGGSYGRFLDRQERAILARFLPSGAGRVLDAGCGVGRLMAFASDGCDASVESLRIAVEKHPSKTFTAADIAALPFPPASFDAAFCFHVLMHLNPDEIRAVFAGMARVLRPGGVFVADVASALRRRLRPRRTQGWRCASVLSRAGLARLAQEAGMRMTGARGVMLAPIHRAPEWIRPALTTLDLRLAALAPDCASYVVGRFVVEPTPGEGA